MHFVRSMHMNTSSWLLDTA